MPVTMKLYKKEKFMHIALYLSFSMVVLGHMKTFQSNKHSFRHQQYSNQRVEQAINNFKRSQTVRNLNQSHLKHNRVGLNEEWDTFTTQQIPGKYHLRHFDPHYQAKKHVFPSLYHTKVTVPPTKIPKFSFNILKERYNVSKIMQSRYFDRDGLYSMSSTENSFIGPDATLGDYHRTVTKSTIDRDDSFAYMESNSNIHMNNNRPIHSHSFNKKKLKIYSDEVDTDDNLDQYYYDDDSMSTDIRNKVDERIKHSKQSLDPFDEEDDISQSYIPGTLTKHKFETLGTHEAVRQSRRQLITNQAQHKVLANAHATKVYMEAACKWPKAKVERIQKDPSKMYVPYCTILHRCGDDTGCCTTDAHTCIAKRFQSVDLYFFVKALGSKQGSIERHTFVNHTECQCVEKSKHITLIPPAAIRKATILDCNCPKHFEKVLQEDGVCRCDCSSGNSGCDWLKRGIEHFSMIDRKCIIEGRCKLPTCEFGNYIRKHGRCPRKEDKLAFSRTYH